MPPLCSIIAEISGLPCVDQNDFFEKRVKEYGKKKNKNLPSKNKMKQCLIRQAITRAGELLNIA